MSIKLPIVNVKDVNWNNHDSSKHIPRYYGRRYCDYRE